jgi:hypothetical protein
VDHRAALTRECPGRAVRRVKAKELEGENQADQRKVGTIKAIVLDRIGHVGSVALQIIGCGSARISLEKIV